MGAAVLIGLDKKGSDEDSAEEVEEMVHYGILAILCACSAPFFWATRVAFFRHLIDTKGFDPTSLAIDGNMWMSIIGSIMCIFFFMNYECSFYDFMMGSLAGIFTLVSLLMYGKILSMGPGGPSDSLYGTYFIYQSLIMYIFLDQDLSTYTVLGLVFGTCGSLFIGMGDSVINYFCVRRDRQERIEQVNESLIDRSSIN